MEVSFWISSGEERVVVGLRRKRPISEMVILRDDENRASQCWWMVLAVVM